MEPFAASSDASLPQPGRGAFLTRLVVVLGLVAAVVTLVLMVQVGRFPGSLGAESFSGTVILALDGVVKDAQGIPYSDTVLYDATSGSYSYIATTDAGLVTPIGPSAFSSGPYYLAMRAGTTTNDFVLYDRATLSPVRIIETLPIGSITTSAVWSSDASRFAYLVTGAPDQSLKVEQTDSSEDTRSLGSYVPVGFSPDGTKLLVRAGTSGLGILSADTGSFSPTEGVIIDDTKTKFIFAPSGAYLVTVSAASAEWYAIDWDTGNAAHLGTVPLTPDTGDVLFTDDDALLVREKGSDVVQLFSYERGEGVALRSKMNVPVPEGAHILHIASW